MASNENLKIVVTADTSGVQSGMTVVRGELEKTAVAAKESSGAVGKVGGALTALKNNIPAVTGALSTVSGEVGNMASSFAGAGSLLTVGLVAVIPLAIAGLASLADALLGLSTEQKAFNEVLESSSKGFTDAYTAVSELRVQADLLNQGIGSGDDFLKNYNDTLGKTIGKTNDLEEAERNLAKFGTTYIQLMYLKSIANTAFAKSSEAVLQSLFLQQQAGGASGIAKDALNSFRKEADETAETFKNLGVNAQKLEAVLQQSLPAKVGGMFSGLLGGEQGVKVTKPVKIKIEKAVPVFDPIQIKDEIDLQFQDILKEPTKGFKGDSQTTLVFPVDLEAKVRVDFTGKPLDKELLKIFDDLKNKTKDVTVIANIMGDVFDTVFENITKGTRSVIQSVGRLIQQLTFAIFKAVALAAIKSAFGGGAFNLGNVFKSLFGGHALGTRSFGGGMTLVGERGPELVSLPQGSSITPNAQVNAMGVQELMLSGTFMQRGTDMVLVFDKTRAQLRRSN